MNDIRCCYTDFITDKLKTTPLCVIYHIQSPSLSSNFPACAKIAIVVKSEKIVHIDVVMRSPLRLMASDGNYCYWQ